MTAVRARRAELVCAGVLSAVLAVVVVVLMGDSFAELGSGVRSSISWVMASVEFIGVAAGLGLATVSWFIFRRTSGKRRGHARIALSGALAYLAVRAVWSLVYSAAIGTGGLATFLRVAELVALSPIAVLLGASAALFLQRRRGDETGGELGEPGAGLDHGAPEPEGRPEPDGRPGAEKPR
ncbi:hypothetical protein [Corynebacterium frankenforstense]|uniref:hypothetical protein n=1 Tax=Corynebacterium frankenforstense TaxID=1230998 RepID=UPI00254DE22D|nr:hypothetical protein [Corynebacterium frankenforstense]MDK6259666.1 hypothetical protein [Corynebacterium frankenforstense]